MVLARKYRPKNFKELIGQEAVCEILTLALDKNQLSFAYLFSGLRGSGKTSTARIFAKALLCQKGVSSTPCEECSNCDMANSASHIDIIEIDAASNRRIDDIRELIEHTKYKPVLARYKIFIIDEVHMLTKEAFNALLKTLEEPPEFIKFILATTDPLKLPATILSRTQHFRFRKISDTILQKHLEKILKTEGIGFETSAIKSIVRFSSGSVRDSLTMLDQAIVYSKGFLSIDIVSQMLGTLNPSEIESLFSNILDLNRDYIKDFVERSVEFEAEVIIDEIILYLKDILLNGFEKLDYNTLYKFFEILEEAKNLLSIGSDGEFVLAITLLKMIEAQKTDTVKVKREYRANSLDTYSKNQDLDDKPSRDFRTLIDKIYNHNKKLGEVFEKNIRFVSFVDRILTWESMANGDERELLKHKFGQIRMYVREVYGDGINIKNISKVVKPKEEIEDKPNKEKQIEKIEPKTYQDRLDELLENEPTLQKVLELFEPKNVILDYKEKESEIS